MSEFQSAGFAVYGKVDMDAVRRQVAERLDYRAKCLHANYWLKHPEGSTKFWEDMPELEREAWRDVARRCEVLSRGTVVYGIAG